MGFTCSSRKKGSAFWDSEAEHNDGQEIWAEKGSAFWDSVLLENLESGKSPNLNDFPPLDESLDYFGVHL